MLKYVAIAVLLLPFPSPEPRANKSDGNQRSDAPQLAATPLDSPNVETKEPSPQAPGGQPEESQRQAEIAQAAQATNNRIANATIVIAVFGGLSFLAACGYIVAALLQWSGIKKQAKKAGEQVAKMEDTLEEMARQRKTLHTQAGAMLTQARIMKEALTQAGIQDERTIDALVIQADAAQRSAKAAESSSKAAEDSAHRMAQAQRPDIALGLKFGVLEVGKRIPFEFEVFNAGKETAYNFGIHIACDWKPVGFDGVLDYGKPKHEAAEPIRPQARRYVHPQWFYPLQPHELFTLMNGTVWLFVYGILWYEDGAGKRYSEPFCRRFDHGSPQDAVECAGTLRSRMVEEIKEENP